MSGIRSSSSGHIDVPLLTAAVNSSPMANALIGPAVNRRIEWVIERPDLICLHDTGSLTPAFY